ncbi:hypothetical protein SAMN06297251_10474 [Fulvimarina manganoxydans]|uniref:Uncharacterized protein n=1 Tax=Fulvimarina manganoxydans TaxID=937218 RepID=A0A1W2ACD2_9HYPH|nr:hypothetical protein [Fulvimarina manganoxydans]SMC58379.1 hypothetical protein SAMN06297251_10474 [Fulvimarina manganoxydans]
MNSPTQIVDRHLASCLQDGRPAAHRMVISVTVERVAAGRRFLADLIMFDGKPASIEVYCSPAGLWSHRFIDLPGGDCHISGGRWRRTKSLAA